MTKENLLAVRALLSVWAKSQSGVVEYETDYPSPPNLIYKFMSDTPAMGEGVCGSREPYGAFRGVVSGGFARNHVGEILNEVIERLPERRKQTIHCEFLKKGTQGHKSKLMNVSIKTYEAQLNLALKQILADDVVKNLVNRA